jgi:hypothetical protein
VDSVYTPSARAASGARSEEVEMSMASKVFPIKSPVLFLVAWIFVNLERVYDDWTTEKALVRDVQAAINVSESRGVNLMALFVLY